MEYKLIVISHNCMTNCFSHIGIGQLSSSSSTYYRLKQTELQIYDRHLQANVGQSKNEDDDKHK